MAPSDDRDQPGTWRWGRNARVQRRSEGVLSDDEVTYCREMGIPLAFDPVQIGWVRLGTEDDLDTVAPPQSWQGSLHRAEGYRFRPWAPADAPALARALSQPHLWDHMPERYTGPIEPNVALELIALNNGSDHHFVRAVEHGGRVIGQVRLEFDPDATDTAELSYWLDPAHWRQGHGARVVTRFVRNCCHRHPHLSRLVARVHRENPASARILEKAGFRRRPVRDDGVWRMYERAAV